MINDKNTYNNKTELSLSALMFFSPLIQNQIKKRTDIDESDKNFIKGFIKIGYINIIILVISIGLQIVSYLTNIILIQNISFVTTIILAISLVIGSIYAISNKELVKYNHNINNGTQNSKINLIVNYIPLYNIYIRYKKHDFENPNTILKESILVWGIISIVCLFLNNENVIRSVITLLIIRVITLLYDINILEKTQKKLNLLFKKNPEELRGYIVGILKTIFNKESLKNNINTSKNDFELILKIEYKQILLEYIILFILSLYLIYNGYINHNIFIVISTIFILIRYIIMIVQRSHVPHLPIIKEITDLFFNNKNR